MKQWALSVHGTEVVEKARELYETDFGKVLFEEDCKYDGDCSLSASDEDEVYRYLGKAKTLLEDSL